MELEKIMIFSCLSIYILRVSLWLRVARRVFRLTLFTFPVVWPRVFLTETIETRRAVETLAGTQSIADLTDDWPCESGGGTVEAVPHTYVFESRLVDHGKRATNKVKRLVSRLLDFPSEPPAAGEVAEGSTGHLAHAWKSRAERRAVKRSTNISLWWEWG